MILDIPNKETLDYYKGILDKLGYVGASNDYPPKYLLTIDDEKRYFTSDTIRVDNQRNISTLDEFNKFYNGNGKTSLWHTMSLGQKLQGVRLNYKRYRVTKDNFSTFLCLIADQNNSDLDQFEKDLTLAGYSWEQNGVAFDIGSVCQNLFTNTIELRMTNGDIVTVDKDYFNELI